MGRPIRASLGKVPVVLAAIVLLGGGIAGVLTINTVSDELGLQVSHTNAAIGDLQLQVEALQQSVADADSTPRIAQEARKLGMGPADDPAIIALDGKGHSTLIGTPTPQAAPVPAAPPASATTAPAATDHPGSRAGRNDARGRRSGDLASRARPYATGPDQGGPDQGCADQGGADHGAQTTAARTAAARTQPAQATQTKPSSAATTGGNR